MIETASLNRFDNALKQCGVTAATLAPGEKEALDRQGYLVLADVIDQDRLVRLRAAFETALRRGQRQGVHVALDWKDAAFDGLYTHPKVLAAVYHVLGRPFITSGVCGRDPAPGYGQQGLHTDGCPPSPSGPFLLVTVLWLLDDFTPHNGATRLIPGSHHMPRPLPKPTQQPEYRHPGQKLILAEAGSALVFNGHLWHGGTRNEAGSRRRVLQGQFRGREMVRPGDTPPDLPERLSSAVRYLLGEGDKIT
jgi:ectoine hydroxylase-related dioxygenase (phytanoyl-CoA dioxygenase family)